MPTHLKPRIIGYRKNGAPIWLGQGGAPTIDELVMAIEVEEEQTQRRHDRYNAEVKDILNRAKAEGRPNLTAEEDADVESAFQNKERAKNELSGIRKKLENARRVQREERENEKAAQTRTVDPKTSAAQKPAYDQVARIGNEERTYHRGNSGKGGLFVRDVVRQFLFRDMEADNRLARHMQEERVERGQYLQRASNTGNFAGLVVPQYLTEMYAPAIAALRPFADICNKHDLPADGMTVNISRITTPTQVQLQASENVDVGGTDIDDTLLTENVLTAAGKAILSRQAIERGTGIEDVTMSDLQRRFATTLDSTLITQATTGLSALGVSVAYNDATPTGAELYPKILGALAGGEAALLAQAIPNFIVMHSRRWHWLSSQMTSTWPLINQPGYGVQAAGISTGVGYNQGVRGILPNGLLVVVDNNIGTTLGAGTEDEAYVVASDECHLWEDPNAPQFIRADQVQSATLGVQLVLYGYFAYSFRRYASAVQKINGTGMIAPVF